MGAAQTSQSQPLSGSSLTQADNAYLRILVRDHGNVKNDTVGHFKNLGVNVDDVRTKYNELNKSHKEDVEAHGGSNASKPTQTESQQKASQEQAQKALYARSEFEIKKSEIWNGYAEANHQISLKQIGADPHKAARELVNENLSKLNFTLENGVDTSLAKQQNVARNYSITSPVGASMNASFGAGSYQNNLANAYQAHLNSGGLIVSRGPGTPPLMINVKSPGEVQAERVANAEESRKTIENAIANNVDLTKLEGTLLSSSK